jgi:GTP-binding protein EngB required for normal cell division
MNSPARHRIMDSSTGSSLNSNHVRRLLVSCEYIDRLLTDIETVLSASSSAALFHKYGDDLTPAQKKIVRDYIARIRAQMARVLAGQEIELPPPQISATHSIRTALDFIDIAAEELRPKYMRGYGEIPPSLVPELNGISGELQGLVQKLNAYLAQGLGADLQGRLARLEQVGNEVELLKLLDQIILEHGLVEFRPRVSTIVERLEANQFEIALFGRVSSGKSSLLNHILESSILPVGVNPITAVPTRLVYSPHPKVRVWLVDRKPVEITVGQLAEYAAEDRNPANSKQVTRIVVEVPSERLRDGVVFVDTPGLGSLATAGAAETLAYLPQCDLGVVLIDAGSTLTQEDLSTIQTLYEAGIPALVLLSKADLLAPSDRERALSYVTGHIKSQLGLQISVHPVSTIGASAALLDQWFAEEIIPLYDRQQQLAKQSVKRKIAALRDSVEATLRLRLNRTERITSEEHSAAEPKEIEAILRRAEGEIAETRTNCRKVLEALAGCADVLLDGAASKIVAEWAQFRDDEGLLNNLFVTTVSQQIAEITKLLHDVLKTLAETLAESLRKAAEALELNDAPTAQEMADSLREMPRPDLGEPRPDLRFIALFAFGEAAARRRIKHRLQAEVGAPLQRTLSAYEKLLEDWAAKRLAAMHHSFAAHADAYRAQLEQLSRGSASAPESHDALRRDLLRLRKWQAGASVLQGEDRLSVP